MRAGVPVGDCAAQRGGAAGAAGKAAPYLGEREGPGFGVDVPGAAGYRVGGLLQGGDSASEFFHSRVRASSAVTRDSRSASWLRAALARMAFAAASWVGWTSAFSRRSRVAAAAVPAAAGSRARRGLSRFLCQQKWDCPLSRHNCFAEHTIPYRSARRARPRRPLDETSPRPPARRAARVCRGAWPLLTAFGRYFHCLARPRPSPILRFFGRFALVLAQRRLRQILAPTAGERTCHAAPPPEGILCHPPAGFGWQCLLG